jgi:ATP adenylyltransferase
MKKIPEKKDKKVFVDIKNARVAEQREVMEKILADGNCPFCSQNLFLYHKKPVLKEGMFWILTENQWPYENTKIHFLAIYKSHAEDLVDISYEAGAELLELFQWVTLNYSVPGGAMVMRFGDMKYSAGSVRHIHAHFLQPEIENKNYKALQFQIGHTTITKNEY